MNAKNGKSLSAALILSLATLSAHAAEVPRTDRIVDLPTITVRPDAAQRAELASSAVAVARIVDLPTMTVRPSPAQRAELAERTMLAKTVDLPTINVHPTAAQLAELAAIVADEHA